MRFTIQSPAGTSAEHENVNAVRTILADNKPLTILPRHAPLMAEVGTEAITITGDDGEATYAVEHGILLVVNDIISVLTTGVAAAEDNDA